MKLRSLMTVICVLATATTVSAAPFAYVANSGTKNVTVIDTADNTIKATVALPDTQQTLHPFAYSVAVGASGQYVYVGLQTTNEVAVIDSARQVVVKRISLGTDSPGGLAVNAAETRLYVASNMSNTLIVINISGSGSSEVGRVTVDDHTISNPEGVVIKEYPEDPAKNRAYVANSSQNSIAEISLDEDNNVYTRLSVTDLGANAQPVGLAINSTGTKLYSSSVNGLVKMIDIATKAVTNLTAGAGTVTVAIKPDDSKVYAPSNSLDKFYVIDSSANPNVVLGNYSLVAGPYGSSVTPDGSKLFVTMNTLTAGNTVKVISTSDNSVAATITLPEGAKPTSMGDFIGPELPFTIKATASGNCTLTPSGDVLVNAIGRIFTAAATSGTCDVRVDGVMQQAGVTGSYDYTFSNVTADHAITAFAPTATCNVTADWTGEALGCLEIPFGSGCATKNTPVAVTCGTNVTIKANSGFKAESWTGACAGTVGDTCIIPSISADKTVGANITTGGGPIYNLTKSIYYQTLAEAVAAASTDDRIKITAAYTSAAETTAGGTAGIMIKLSTGWDNDYVASSSSKMPPLTIGAVGIIVDPAAGHTLTL